MENRFFRRDDRRIRLLLSFFITDSHFSMYFDACKSIDISMAVIEELFVEDVISLID